MELKRIDNLWRFLGIKNNLKLEAYLEEGIIYHFQKGNQELIHHLNPKFLQQSSLCLREKSFQNNFVFKNFESHKQRFGVKQKSFSPASTIIFFPKELLSLKYQYDIKIEKDRYGHFQVCISPFNPKTVYDILNAVNLIHRTLWGKNFFAEGIRN
jgi:hypothetical protein